MNEVGDTTPLFDWWVDIWIYSCRRAENSVGGAGMAGACASELAGRLEDVVGNEEGFEDDVVDEAPDVGVDVDGDVTGGEAGVADVEVGIGAGEGKSSRNGSGVIQMRSRNGWQKYRAWRTEFA